MKLVGQLVAALALLGPQILVAAREGNYLVNCVTNKGEQASAVFYYSDTNRANSPNLPDDLCSKTSKGFFIWEQSWGCTFPNSGVTFSATLKGGAGQFQFAGTGNNGFKNFECRRDNDRVILDVTQSGTHLTCRSIYYCLE